MKKLALILIGMFLIGIVPALGLISSVTVNFPYNNMFNASSDDNTHFVLNATAVWTDPTNVTNVTIWFGIGTNYTGFTNSTVNGSLTSTTEGDFTFNISVGQLAEGQYTVIAEARNDSEIGNDASSFNSTGTVTFTIDRTAPSAVINSPSNGETVIPLDDVIRVYYTPTDTYLANATLYVDNVANSKSTSDGLGGNITSGSSGNYLEYRPSASGSDTFIVEVIDLAGTKVNSSAVTIDVLLASEGGSPIVSNGGTHGGVITDADLKKIGGESASSFIQKYLFWIIVIVIIVFLVRKKMKR